MKLFRQIVSLILIAACFVGYDVLIWNLITKRYINDAGNDVQVKSIELDKYLPFDENSSIVPVESELTLSGELPVLDGASALYPVFSAVVESVYPEGCVEFDGDVFTPESALHFSNTRGAYKAVVDGDADVIFCAKPSAEQLEYAQQNGVTLELVPIGYEAFVFIVNAENPVESLTVDQVRGIYSGRYTNWSQFGGDNAPIDALQRSEGSGSQTAMLSFMNGEEMKRNPFAFAGRSIGYSFRYYVSDIVENGSIKMLSLNGVYPSSENIANGSYPVISNFYAVYRKGDDNPNVDILIDWLLSEEGQAVVEQNGYVPLA